MKITTHENESAILATTISDIDRVLSDAAEEARAQNKINIVFIEADNGNEISIAVGGEESVLGGTYDHNSLP